MDRATFVLTTLLALVCQAYGRETPASLPPVPTKTIPEGSRRDVDADQAMKIAEEFVRANGYTDFTPSDLSKLKPEPIEMSDDREEWLKDRHDTVRPQAHGYMKGTGNSRDGWRVVFARTKPPNNDPNIGVGVAMDKTGNNVRFMHMGVGLNFYTRRSK